MPSRSHGGRHQAGGAVAAAQAAGTEPAREPSHWRVVCDVHRTAIIGDGRHSHSLEAFLAAIEDRSFEFRFK